MPKDKIGSNSIPPSEKISNQGRDTLATVYHYDLYGKREEKYDFLQNNTLETVPWTELEPHEPNYFFVPKDFSLKEEYEKGFKVNELFVVYNSGIKTDRDSLFIDNDRNQLAYRIKILLSGNFDERFKEKYRVLNSSSYKLVEVIKRKHFDETCLKMIQYRPFDIRWIYYSPSVISRPANQVMKNFVGLDNIGLIMSRQQSTFDFQHIFVSKIISESCSISSQTKEGGYVFPLYLYPDAFNPEEREPNLNPIIVAAISNRLKCQSEIDPTNILDYIYGVLHNPEYREKYKEFLKIDFPRVPYPESAEEFWHYVKIGGELRKLHLLEGVEAEDGVADYPVAGSDVVESVSFPPPVPPINVGGKVYINSTQYFDNVPKDVWEFYIGGYQPAQKWLKDRKGRALSYDDIRHYQKIIVALKRTKEIMDGEYF